MSTLVITTNVTTPDNEDKRAMDFVIANENARRAALNPPGTPLPNSTAGERKTSYETILSGICKSVLTNQIDQANKSVEQDQQFRDLKPLWKDASPQKKAAAIAALS